MSDEMEHVTLEAFVPKRTILMTIEADKLRRLRAENKVLRELADELDHECIHLAGDSWWGGSGEREVPWEVEHNFEDRVQAALDE